jgi:hypothetical protein
MNQAPILASPPFRHPHLAPPRQGLKSQKQSAHTIASILVVVAFYGTNLAGSRRTHLLQQLFRALVHTHHRSQGILRTTIDLQNILHAADKLGVLLRGGYTRCGLISFFSGSVVWSRKRSTPRAPRPPSGPPAGAGSSEHDRQEEGYRPEPTGGLPVRHRADDGKVAASPGELPEIPSFSICARSSGLRVTT